MITTPYCCDQSIGLDPYWALVTETTCMDCGRHCHVPGYGSDVTERLNRWRCRDCWRQRKLAALEAQQ